MSPPRGPWQLRGRTAKRRSRAVQVPKHKRCGHGGPARREAGAGSTGSRRPPAQRGCSAPSVAEDTARLGRPSAGEGRERARGLGPRRPRPPARLRCQHLPSSPPRAPAGRPGRAGHLEARPAAGHCLAPSSQPLRWAPRAGGGRPSTCWSRAHLAWAWRLPTTPPASNPGFRASGSEGGAGSSGFRRSPPESRPSLTVTRATVGVAAASRTGRGCAWIGLSGARGGVAGGFALKWLQRCSRSERKGTRWWGTSSCSLRLPGQTGPDGEVDSGWSLALLSRTSLALRESRDLRLEPNQKAYWRENRWHPRRFQHLRAPTVCWPQGHVAASPTRRAGQAGGSAQPRTVPVGFRDSWRCGPTGRLALRVLAASPDKGPWVRGSPRGGFTSSPTPRARFPLGLIPKPDPPPSLQWP